MKQEEILSILNTPDIIHYLDDISEIHQYTKHYVILAEELSEDGDTFLQPLKEHRDAYEHLMRIFNLPRKKTNSNFNYNVYIADNIKKAFGHEYRAFFDAADWITYICRKQIREALSSRIVRKKYEKHYDFKSTKKFINEVPFMVANFREGKDVSSTEGNANNDHKNTKIGEVLAYKEMTDRLIKIYRDIQSL